MFPLIKSCLMAKKKGHGFATRDLSQTNETMKQEANQLPAGM